MCEEACCEIDVILFDGISMNGCWHVFENHNDRRGSATQLWAWQKVLVQETRRLLPQESFGRPLCTLYNVTNCDHVYSCIKSLLADHSVCSAIGSTVTNCVLCFSAPYFQDSKQMLYWYRNHILSCFPRRTSLERLTMRPIGKYEGICLESVKRPALFYLHMCRYF